jgi:hypothetical protein
MPVHFNQNGRILRVSSIRNVRAYTLDGDPLQGLIYFCEKETQADLH